MQTQPTTPVLPDDSILREKLAAIIADVCRSEPAPLLEDQSFSAVITQFDSLAILEILLEVETQFNIPTDEMLPADHATGAQEITSVFPSDLSALIVYMHKVVARMAEGPAEGSVAARVAQAAERRAGSAGNGPQPDAVPSMAAPSKSTATTPPASPAD